MENTLYSPWYLLKENSKELQQKMLHSLFQKLRFEIDFISLQSVVYLYGSPGKPGQDISIQRMTYIGEKAEIKKKKKWSKVKA